MAAPDSTKFQVNYKLADGTLINLYASDVRELETGLTDLSMVSALITSTAHYGFDKDLELTEAEIFALVKPRQLRRKYIIKKD